LNGLGFPVVDPRDGIHGFPMNHDGRFINGIFSQRNGFRRRENLMKMGLKRLGKSTYKKSDKRNRKKDFKRKQKDAVEFLTNKGKEAKQARAAVDIQKIARGRKVRNQTNLIKAEQNSMGIEDKRSKRVKDRVRFVETPGLDKM
jgi:hypothetical protein